MQQQNFNFWRINCNTFLNTNSNILNENQIAHIIRLSRLYNTTLKCFFVHSQSGQKDAEIDMQYYVFVKFRNLSCKFWNTLNFTFSSKNMLFSSKKTKKSRLERRNLVSHGTIILFPHALFHSHYSYCFILSSGYS